MQIDIVICTFNRYEKLKRAVQSLLEADIPENAKVRLLVVDNNSTDGTEGITKMVSSNSSGMEIKYLFEGKQGKSFALNAALGQLSGDIIAFCDDDQTVGVHYLKEIADAAVRHPKINCFGGKVIAVYPERLPEWLDMKGPMKFLTSVFGDKNEGDNEVEYGTATVSETPGGGNMFFRRAAVEKNGPFRTDLGPVGHNMGFSEDTEYCRRLIGRGERFMYIPSVIVYHPAPPERLSREYLLHWQYRCGRSEARRYGGYKGCPTILGTPRYLFKKFAEHAAGWLFSLGPRNRFYHRLRLYFVAGEVIEHLVMGKGA